MRPCTQPMADRMFRGARIAQVQANSTSTGSPLWRIDGGVPLPAAGVRARRARQVQHARPLPAATRPACAPLAAHESARTRARHARSHAVLSVPQRAACSLLRRRAVRRAWRRSGGCSTGSRAYRSIKSSQVKPAQSALGRKSREKRLASNRLLFSATRHR